MNGGLALVGDFVQLPDGRVLTPGGYTIDADTAAQVALSTPANTRRGRESRSELYVAWCTERALIPGDPGTVPDYCAHLSRQRHPAATIEAYASTLANLLAVNGKPLTELDRMLIRGIVNHRSAQDASDPDGAADALQSTACTREGLRAMVATLNRTTEVGKRDAVALILDWYLAGRSSEPGGLGVHDLVETVAHVDADGGPVELAALEVTFRKTKTNAYGRTTSVVRLVEQTPEDSDICPVRAVRAWVQVLRDHDLHHSGPFLRGIHSSGKIGGTPGRHGGTCVGRTPADPRRAGGYGGRSVRNLIRRCARAADLVRPLEPQEVQLMSTTAEAAELAQASTDTERETIRADRRVRRRALRRGLVRITGHSMRRGLIQHLDALGAPRHVIEQHARFAPGSKALARYRVGLLPWAENPTLLMRHRQQPAGGRPR